MNKEFRKVNKNPFKAKIGDCFVRAICTALNKEYYDVVKELAITFAIGCSKRVNGYHPQSAWTLNALFNINYYLWSNGYTRYKCCGSVKTLARINTTGLPTLIYTSGHLVATDGNGKYVDTFDSGNNHARYIWLKDGRSRRRYGDYIIKRDNPF